MWRKMKQGEIMDVKGIIIQRVENITYGEIIDATKEWDKINSRQS